MQNDHVRQHSNHVAHGGHSRTMPKHGYSAQSADHPPYGEEDEERFSRFTEYRGGNGGSNTMGGGRRENSYDRQVKDILYKFTVQEGHYEEHYKDSLNT